MDWHVILEPVGRPGPENMALDEVLLDEADRTSGGFLRLYRWSPPCLSLGRNEPALRRYDRARIEQLGLDVVRRPTGGRAVWHEHEVTYAVAAPIAAFGSLAESYRAIHERLASALRLLGVPAVLAPSTRVPALDGRLGACFAAPVGGEVVVHGKKLIGSAQVRLGSAFLQHGSILLDGSQEMVAAVSYQPSAVSSSTSLSAILGRSVGFGEVAQAIVSEWEESSALASTHLDPPRPASTVHARSSPPSTARFSDQSWTWRR